MQTFTNLSVQLKITGAVLAIAALAAVLLAVFMTAGPTMAQTDPSPDPKPCGPGQEDVPESPDATITSGHYAVFDGYWDSVNKTMNLNLCPPAVEHMLVTPTDPDPGEEKEEEPAEEDEQGDTPPPQEEVSTRTASNIDIQRTVFHIEGSDFEHTLTAADVEEYDFFKLHEDKDNNGVDDAVGQTVWWLKVDDPDTEADEDSALAMGFSAALFDSDHWHLDDGDSDLTDEGAKPLQYEFEVIREPGIPITELGHVFAFDDTPAPTEGEGANIKTAYWDSSEIDANALPLYPGKYHHFQWAFTKPGTYVISVQLKGHVRQTNPHSPGDDGYDANWKPVSEKTVETSEVRQYVFQIGALTLNEEPIFEVERSVQEHAPHNAEHVTSVGAPIPVYQDDPDGNDPLTFTLTGPGHSLFSVGPDDDGNAQIKVAGDLDHEVLSEYRLTLGVSDGYDRERNADSAVDSAISVKINVTNQEEVERSVAENSAANTLVGALVDVTDADTNTLSYTLSGHGHNLFSVERDATTGDAQIKTAGLGGLDYEARSTYHLTLGVTGYTDPLNDYTLVVIVTVTDVDEDDVAEAGATDQGVTIKSLTGDGQLPQTVTTNTEVKLWASIGDLPPGATNLRVGWGVQDPDGDPQVNGHTGSEFHNTFTYDTPATRAFQVRIVYDLNGHEHWFWSPVVNVIWQD